MNLFIPNILLVEDNPGDINLFIEILRLADRPAKLVIKRDGEDGFEYIKAIDNNVKPDLIILDINLPKKNGLEILSAIRNIEKLKSIPAIMLTSSQNETDMELSYKLGANAYLHKTYDIDDYILMVKAIFKFWLGIKT